MSKGKVQSQEQPQPEEAVGIRVGFRPFPGIRTWGDYEWSEATNWEQVVDIATAADIVAYPYPGFILLERPPDDVAAQIAALIGVPPRSILWPKTTVQAKPAAPSIADIVGDERAGQLATAFDLVSLGELAALGPEQIEALEQSSGASREEIESWIGRARAATK